MADAKGDLRTAEAADGTAIEYEVVGDGPPVALLHGGLAGRFAYSRQRDELSADRRLILPSFRGHDGTPWIVPQDYGVSTSDVQDVVVVLDAEGAERVDMVGHSSGGATAFAFACRFPDRVNRLVLIEPSLFALLPPQNFDRVSTAIKKVIEIGGSGDDLAALRGTVDLVGGEDWRRLDEDTKKRRLDRLAPMAPFVTPHWRGLLDFPVTAVDLKALKPPTLLIYGGASLEFEALIAACWRTHRPDVSQILVEGAGHNVQLEQSDIVTPAITAFLNG